MKISFALALIFCFVGCGEVDIAPKPSINLKDRAFVGDDVDAPYGWIQEGRRLLRNGEINESLFYSKEVLCKDALRRIDIEKGTGMVDDLEFYQRWCR